MAIIWFYYKNRVGLKIPEIKNIKARNARVELDKKWETSWTRRLCDW